MKKPWGVLVAFLFAAPLVPLLLVNLYKLSVGVGAEPLADNIFMYAVLLIAFGVATIGLGIILAWRGLRDAAYMDAVVFAAAGAITPGVLALWIDVTTTEFWSGPRIGWQLPVTALVLGALYGVGFRGICALMAVRVRPRTLH